MANDTNLMNDVSLTHIVQDSGQSTSTPTESSELQVHYSGQSTSTPTNSCEPQVQDSGESTSTPTNNSELQSTEILNLLKSCNDGKALLLNETLDNSSRNKLCDLIITFELKNDPNAVISSARLMNLANQIVSIFKKEHKSTYFIPYINYNAQKKAAKGKLLNSLHKLRRKYRKLGLINSRRSSASSSTSTSSSKTLDWSDVWNSEDCPEPSDDIKNKLRWLTNSTTPLETVQTYWKETAECRIKTQMKSNKSISEYIAEYPALKKPTGYVLLMEDFGYMYPEKVDCLTSEFPLYKDKILQLGRKKSDINIKAILNKLEENNNPDLIEELSSYTAFCVLPYLLTPHTITKGKDAESGKKTWRPSRSEMKDGFITEVACVGDLKKTINHLDDYLTFDISNGLYMYSGKGNSKSAIVTWNSYNQPFSLQDGYFSITQDENAIAISSIQAYEVTKGELLSPIFTPQSNNLCLAITYQSSSPSILDFYAVGLLANDKYLLDTISIAESGWRAEVVNISLDNLNPIKLSIAVDGLAKVNIARIASCNPDGEDVAKLPTTPGSSNCPSVFRYRPWGDTGSSVLYTSTTDILDPVEQITNVTNHCWNGGVLTSAGCACTPGFSGSSCEIGCGRNRFGQDCEGLCSYHSEECRGLLLCNKLTGCNCAPGYHGDTCTQECTSGWYGNDCEQKCGNCAGNSTCDIYTGECNGCQEGYLAPHCKLATVYYGSKPDVSSPSYGTISVAIDPNNYVTHGEDPQLYQIQLREKGSQWKIYTTKTLLKSSEESEKEKKIVERIVGLKTGIVYQVRLLLIDPYFHKYDGDLVQAADILTKCDIPSNYDYKLTAVSNSSSISFTWKYILEDANWCPLEEFEVQWKEGWERKSIFTRENFTLDGLVPGLPITFKVRAITTGGAAPYSKTLTTSTKLKDLPAVRNLRVVSSQSSSVEVSWDPPRGSGDNQLRYTVSYQCVDRPACSPGCQNVSGGRLTQEGTSITLSPLLPFTKYLVTVSADGGLSSSINVGTTKVVPTEVPSLSGQKPLRSNTSVTVFWDQPTVCTGFLLGYNYQLTEASNSLTILASGFTKELNASFHNLTASTEYVIRVYVSTISGWNPLSYLAINVSTSATVPEAVRNLTVYKRGRGMVGLRWAEPRASYGQLKSFTVTHTLGQETTSHTVEPARCVVWPDLYCHTVEGLRSNKRYNFSVSARNSEVAEDGELAFVSTFTKENPPSAPVNLKVTNSSSTSLDLEWGFPDMANGIVRSFLISVEETEKYDQDSCCQIYPFVETSVKEELQTYNAEVSGLHPASTYFVSVSAKTVGLGPSQSLVAYTRPPHLPHTALPRVQIPEVTWQPQEKLPEANNSDIYSSLIRAHLLLAVLNESLPIQAAPQSGITDPKLEALLQQRIGKPYHFIAEYNQDDDVDLNDSLEVVDSPWGRPPAPLTPGVVYQLIAAQVVEYNGVYNVDLRYSQPFTLPN